MTENGEEGTTKRLLSAEARCAGRSLISPSQIHEGEWGIVYRVPMFRPPGTPRALPLRPNSFTLTFSEGSPTVSPSVHYDPGGPWEWHGFLQDGVWSTVQNGGTRLSQSGRDGLRAEVGEG
jgi:hypothetical protein